MDGISCRKTPSISPKQGNTCCLHVLSFKCSWSGSQTQQMKAVCLSLCGDGKQAERQNIKDHQSLLMLPDRIPVATHFKAQHCSFLTLLGVQPIFHCDWLTNASPQCFYSCLAAEQLCESVEISTAAGDRRHFLSENKFMSPCCALPGRYVTQFMVKAFTSTAFCPQGEEHCNHCVVE